jgi:hypothetical protein
MDDTIRATFCVCDDLLKAMQHQENRQCQRNAAAILTTAFTAAFFFRGHHESARARLKQHGYIPDMLSKSRLNRRLHRIKEICLAVFDLLAPTWKTFNTEAISLIESLPIAVCDNLRLRRSKLYSGEDLRGYQASKNRYVSGLKIPLRVTPEGQPVACFLPPGSFGEVEALPYSASALPDGSIMYADKAYNDEESEALLQELDHMPRLPIRKKNSKRAWSPAIAFVQGYHRKRVETAGRLIAQLLPKAIHGGTSQGFELKVALFVIASSLNGYLNL